MTTRVRRRTRWLQVAGAILALTLVAAACGDDDDEAGTTSTTTSREDGGFIGDEFEEVEWQGVTDDTITIGVPWLFFGDAGEDDPSFAAFHGRIRDHFDSVLARFRDEGRLPVHGRDIKVVTASYTGVPGAERPEDQRAACVRLVKDEQVALVNVPFAFGVGFECVAAENRVPAVMSDNVSEAVLERSLPYGFSIGTSEERIMRNLPHWADSAGLLTGDGDEPVGVGVYHSDDATTLEKLRSNFGAQLTELGHPEPVYAGFTEVDNPQTADLAVQRFKNAGVGLVFVTGDRGNFLRAASNQKAEWGYVDSDFQYGTTDAGTAGFPADQYERVRAITGRHGGEPASGLERTSAQQECVDGYESYTAELAETDDYYPEGGWKMEDSTFHLQSVYHACDLMETTVQMLEAVGPNVTADSIVAGYESLGGPMEWARTLRGGFSADEYHGGDFFRILSWAAECPTDAGNLTSCYFIDEDDIEPQPFFVP